MEGEMKEKENERICKTYKEAIEPHVLWIKEHILKSKDGEIQIKVSYFLAAMGEDFVGKDESSIYTYIKDILLENGIKMSQYSIHDTEYDTKDGAKCIIYCLTMAKDDEIISSKDARYLKRLETAKRMGIDSSYETHYNHQKRGILPTKDSPESPLYFGEYIEKKYVSSIFEDVKPFEYPKNKYGRILDVHKPYDWICKNGYKIKHVSSCIRTDSSHKHRNGTPIPYYSFLLRKNPVPDYWIISGWDNRDNLEPQYVWIINGHKDFCTQTSIKPFFDRSMFVIYITRKGIQRMNEYLVGNKLEELKEVCNLVRMNKELMI